MTKFISTPSRTKEILEKYGIHAKKGFGQNFLVDPIIVERCAKEAHCEGAVIEIGPGIGSLTEQLAIHSQKVVAYEIDESLPPILEDTLSAYDNVEVILQDFLKADVKEKVNELKEQYGQVTVCANLPYYITSPVLFKIFDIGDAIPYITVMMQKEVGDRFIAKPNDSEYGALSVEGQYLYDVKKLFTVPGRSFNPSPKVDSVIIQFSRKENVDLTINLNDFFEFVRACFKQRRKTLYNNLKEYLKDSDKTKQVMESVNVPLGVRAQELDVDTLKRLYEATL